VTARVGWRNVQREPADGPGWERWVLRDSRPYATGMVVVLVVVQNAQLPIDMHAAVG